MGPKLPFPCGAVGGGGGTIEVAGDGGVVGFNGDGGAVVLSGGEVGDSEEIFGIPVYRFHRRVGFPACGTKISFFWKAIHQTPECCIIITGGAKQ